MHEAFTVEIVPLVAGCLGRGMNKVDEREILTAVGSKRNAKECTDGE